MTKYAARDLVLKVGAHQFLSSIIATTDLFTATAIHGLSADDKVFVTSVGGGAAGLTLNKEYFVLATGLTTTAFKLSLTSGGAAIDVTSDMTGTGTFFKALTVGQTNAIGPAGSARDLIDASAYGDAFKDYVVGQQDGAEVELTVTYDPANASHVLLKTLYDAGLPCDFLMTHALATTFKVTFPALLTKLERGGERDGLLAANLTAKILNPGVTDAT